VVLTSVDRDDLDDGGSIQFAETIRAIKQAMPEAIVEVLTSDFEGSERAMDCILDAGPEIFSHNLETVAGLQPVIRPQASYGRSLAVLRYAAQRGAGAVIKSGLMVGLGETDEELLGAMTDLREAGCELLTVGQYLCPTKRHAEVKRFVPPETFEEYARQAKELGFAGVASGPMVRSSYKAEELYAEAMAAR
jgi:lipoic acid synthetase